MATRKEVKDILEKYASGQYLEHELAWNDEGQEEGRKGQEDALNEIMALLEKG